MPEVLWFRYGRALPAERVSLMEATSHRPRFLESLRSRFGVAHQSVGLLGVAASLFGLASLVRQPPNIEVAGPIPLVIVILAALGYGLSTAVVEWACGRRLRRNAGFTSRVLMMQAIGAVAILAAGVLVMVRDQHSQVLLARIEGLLTACGTLAALVLVLVTGEAVVRRGGESKWADQTMRDRGISLTAAGAMVLGIVLGAAVLWMEQTARPSW